VFKEEFPENSKREIIGLSRTKVDKAFLKLKRHKSKHHNRTTKHTKITKDKKGVVEKA